MADDGERDAGTNAAVIVGGKPLITKPLTEEDVRFSLLQHGRLIVEAYKDAAQLIHHIIHTTPEAARPRAFRILADTWRHLTPEEQVFETLKPFGSLMEATVKELLDEFSKQVTILSAPISPSKN